MNKHGHPSRDLAQDYTAADSTQDYTAADLSVFGSIPVRPVPIEGQPIRYLLALLIVCTLQLVPDLYETYICCDPPDLD